MKKKKIVKGFIPFCNRLKKKIRKYLLSEEKDFEKLSKYQNL